MSTFRRLAVGVLRKNNCLLTPTTITTGQRRNKPYCSVDTNLNKMQIRPDLHIRLTKLLAGILGKDEKLITVSIRSGVTMSRGGSTSPNAVVQIWSIGVFDAERNPKYSKDILNFLSPELKIAPERIVLFFHPINKETAGHLLYAEQSS